MGIGWWPPTSSSTGKLLWQDVKDYDGKSDEASALVIKDGLVFATWGWKLSC
jgi:hypothetical protein